MTPEMNKKFKVQVAAWHNVCKNSQNYQ